MGAASDQVREMKMDRTSTTLDPAIPASDHQTLSLHDPKGTLLSVLCPDALDLLTG